MPHQRRQRARRDEGWGAITPRLEMLLTVASRAERSSRIVFIRSAKPAETPQSSDVGVMHHD